MKTKYLQKINDKLFTITPSLTMIDRRELVVKNILLLKLSNCIQRTHRS
jgi:hypothetical protein